MLTFYHRQARLSASLVLVKPAQPRGVSTHLVCLYPAAFCDGAQPRLLMIENSTSPQRHTLTRPISYLSQPNFQVSFP